VYTVDFGRRTVKTVFIPTADETVLFAEAWRDDGKDQSLAFIVSVRPRIC
jgi:hypothetical protein